MPLLSDDIHSGGGMTPARLAECRTILGWPRRELARRLARSEQNIRQMESGDVRIPQNVAEWLERLAKFHERNPPPTRD
jgi:ribosome-binding protein aMBF1 (putative translation factor)